MTSQSAASAERDRAFAIIRGRRWASDGTGQRVREAVRLNRRELADLLGVTYQAVMQWETGLTAPTAENAIEYAALIAALAEEGSVDIGAQS